MDNQQILDTIHYLFNRDWDEDLTDAQEDELETQAINLIKVYGWERTYSVFTQYLFQEVTTPEQAINVASILWLHPWLDQNIPDVYALLSYFYYRVNMDADRYDSQGILDSHCITLLPKAGYPNADLMKNPYYTAETDPRMLTYVDKWKKGENLFSTLTV